MSTSEIRGSLDPGAVVADKYEVLGRIGAGGMGSVHAARRRDLGDVVAIKTVLPERLTPRNHALFLREARALARIRHPNVVSVFDFGELEDGRPFMVMEYIEGPTLSAVSGEGVAPLPLILEVFGDICRAVEAGHRRGVVHRDLKPSNIMLARSDDGGETVKVLDFGLASLSDEDGERSRAGGLVGTCAYMAPECIRSGSASPASDLFSLGVLLYELVTGRMPFEGQNAIATVMAICEGEYPAPRSVVPTLPVAVEDAITAALSGRPGERPGSALELAALARGEVLGHEPEHLLGTSDFWGLGARSSRDSQGWSRPERGSTFFSAGSRAELWGAPGAPSRPLSGSPDDTLAGDLPTLDGSRAAGDEDRCGPLGPGSTSEVSIGESRSGSQGGASLAGVRAALTELPFVGRELELESLSEQLAGVQPARAGGVSMVLGIPGVGRSRLLERVRDEAKAQGAAVFEGCFWSYDGGRAPAGETFERMLGEGGAAASAPPPTQDRRSGLGALAQRFVARAGGRTLVLVLDDLHRAPLRDLEFLTFLLRGRGLGAQVQVIGSARRAEARNDAHSELSRWLLQIAGLPGHAAVVLPPLDEDQLRACLERTFGRLRIRPRDLRRMHRASAGVPRTFAAVLRHLISSELIHRVEDGSWVCEKLPLRVLPESLRSSTEAELASLDAGLRKVLETAAVLGETLGFDALARTLGEAFSEDELDELVDAAVAEGFLEELEGGAMELRFRSRTVYEVLYAGLGARRRRRLHRAVIEALLRGPDPRRAATALAGHYRAMGEWRESLAWGLRAARQALGHHDQDAAEHALEQAQQGLETLEREGSYAGAELEGIWARVRVDAVGGTLDARVGRFAEGVSRLRGVSSLLDAHGDELRDRLGAEQGGAAEGEPSTDSLRFDVWLSLARCHLGLGQLEASAGAGRRALALAQAQGSGSGSGLGGGALEAEWEARVALGHTLGRFGDWSEASAVLRPVVESEVPPALRVLHVLALRELGWVEARSGRTGRADALAREAEAEAKTSREPLAEYCAHSLRAVTLSARGETQAAVARYRDALRGARALSLRRREMIEQANLCMSLVSLGTPSALDEALEGMLGVIAICEELGDAASAGDARVGLGRVLRARGDLDEAVASFRRGFHGCEAAGRREYAALALHEIGRCELQRETWGAAREVLELARERLGEGGSLHSWEIELDLGRAARGLGDEAEALARAVAAQAALDGRGEIAGAADAIATFLGAGAR